MMRDVTLTRRAFLATATTSAVVAGCATRTNRARVVPKRISPNERLNIALIGCGGRGYENLKELKAENIVALCDIDSERAGKAFSEHPTAERFDDYRRLLDKAGMFDAVAVSTPDHTHAPASVQCMRLGKHVYCEKPLARTIHEARFMARTATEYGVATQMGTQGVGFDNTRTGIEMLRAGVVGTPKEIHVWTDRALNGWPQGVERPADMPPVPDTVNWKAWLGTAPARPYHPAYHPFKWRGWKDFGSGAIGDMGIHNAAIAYLGLQLGMPNSARATSSPLFAETFPAWAELRFEFPAQGKNPALTLYWYDGGHKPPAALIDGESLDGNGCIIVGDQGRLYSVDWAGDVHHLYPKKDFAGYTPPSPSLPRVKSHHQEWIDACKGGPAPMCNFVDFAAPMTEIMQLGNLALLVGKDLQWDTAAMRAPNAPEADALIRPTYADGEHIDGLG